MIDLHSFTKDAVASAILFLLQPGMLAARTFIPRKNVTEP